MKSLALPMLYFRNSSSFTYSHELADGVEVIDLRREWFWLVLEMNALYLGESGQFDLE